MVGINFSQVHELFDEFTDQVRDPIDLIAERAVTLGGVARGTVQASAKDSVLPAFPLEELDERRLLEELLTVLTPWLASSVRLWTIPR
jgi:starvation-inducible DNA-binding protein